MATIKKSFEERTHKDLGGVTIDGYKAFMKEQLKYFQEQEGGHAV